LGIEPDKMFSPKKHFPEETMPNNLQLYHMIERQLCQWLPKERSTRIRNMALFLSGLYLSGQPHLSKIARKWPLLGKLPSLTNRLWRFLNNPRVDVANWYAPVAQEIIARLPAGRIVLVVDTTKVGFYHRMLSIGVAFKKRSLPLAWSVRRGRKGHTLADEQLALFKKVARMLPKQAEIWVVGDTEFQSVRLLRGLRRQNWHFVIRQQGKNAVRWAGQDWLKINRLPLQSGQTCVVGWVRLTKKHDAGWYWLLLHWERGEEEPWYLVSDQPGKAALLSIYRRRMWVEETYGDLKGHGFDLEATHLNDANRIARLVLGFCIVFVWLITLGSWVVKSGYRHLVDHKSRRDKSYFRIGWDWVERCLSLQRPIRLRFQPYF
jgi:hypothetical protein